MFDRLYEKKWWKYALLIFAFLIAVMSLLYTNNLVDKLSKEEKRKAELWANAYKHLNQMGDEMGDITFLLDVIRSNETVPVILVDENDNIVSAKNLNEDRMNQESYLREQLDIMKAGHAPIEIEYAEGGKNYIYYKDSVIVQQLRYFPYAQLFVISIFLLVAYLAFNASRKYEQNRVWVGMAKETAHQLGTPLSSLIAWVEYFKEAGDLKLDKSIVTELEKDLSRLTVVTERFSKIGSSPILKKENMFEVLNQSVEYFNTRISKKISIKFINLGKNDVHAFISRPLFEWVIENLLKNAIDAMNGEGSIVIELSETPKYIIIDVSDTGKGIARSDFENVFKPGFSTRRRGWGLGLSLAKRIVNNYHKGEIFVKESEIGKGTVMRIRLLN